MLPEALQVIKRVTDTFNTLGIDYFVGGSVASSLHGIFRATQDIDFISTVREEHIPRLVAALQDDFYVDGDMMLEVVREHSSFNVIHLPTMIKVDVFIAPPSSWREQEWSRRRLEDVGMADETTPIFVASAEDMILQKLLWYRMTGEQSDRQWGDVQGMLKVQGDALDFGYLHRWADEIGVADLLSRALDDAGLAGR